MKRYRKLKLFPHYLYIAQCSCRASHLILGPGGMAALSAPPGSSMPGLRQGCCAWQGCGCLWSAPPAPGAWEVPPQWLCQCVRVREAEVFLSDSCGSFRRFQSKVVFPPLIERGSFQNLVCTYVDI